MSTIQPVKGTRDFYPEEMAFRRWLSDKIRHVSESYGYQEFEGPLLERLELYAAKSGEELVLEQAYVFDDRGGDRIALRPELTPTLARMVAQRVRAMPLPIRWWSFGPFWRYEQPQKGRTREFFQWNIDILGLDRAQADAEIAAVAVDFFRAVGLGPSEVQLLVNNRRLVERQLTDLGIPEAQFSSVFKLIDRRDKLESNEVGGYAKELGIAQAALAGVEQLLDDPTAWKQSEELVEFFEAGDALGFEDYVRYEPTVIRGLDYYTGTVFEARDLAGEQRAILGGGRYDNLVAEVGGDPVPGVGFALGDVVIELVLREAGHFPNLPTSPAQVLVTTFDADTEPESLLAVRELRRQGLSVEWFPEPARLARQFRYADRYGIAYALVIGPDEAAADQVALKDLVSGEQTTMKLVDVAAVVRRKQADLPDS